MKWPFVSRAALDRALENAEAWQAAYLLERGAHCTTRDRLLLTVDKLTAMQRAGYNPTPPEPIMPPMQRMDPEIRAALDGRFPGNSPHKAMVLRQIEQWQEEGRENSWIARHIWDGEDAADG